MLTPVNQIDIINSSEKRRIFYVNNKAQSRAEKLNRFFSDTRNVPFLLEGKMIMKEIAGYDGKYFACSDGRIFSKNGKYGKCKFLSPIKKTGGYLHVSLYKNRKLKQMAIHRLIALSFLQKQEGKNHVNHLNGNPKDNNVNNLEWCTPKENVHHALYVLKRSSNSNKQRLITSIIGKNNRKLSINDANKIRKEYSLGNTSSRKLSKKYNLSKPCILRIINNKSYLEE